MEYEAMLKKARESMPDIVHEKERFEVPRVTGHVQGNRTIVSNFSAIAAILHRPREHMLKYILKALATPGEIKKSGVVIFGSKVPASRINEKIKQYASEYVLCSKCGKPDTQIIKEDEGTYMKCTACGVKYPLRGRM